jgi:organic radical activating enzyme
MKCDFCDTDFTCKSEYELQPLLTEVKRAKRNLIVLTGGEPLIQPQLFPFVHELFWMGKDVALETNGVGLDLDMSTLINEVEHITLSPKTPVEKLSFEFATDLKLLYPYLKGCCAEDYKRFNAENYFIQPVYGNEKEAYREVMRLGHPWRLSLQTHKYIGVR